MAATGDCHLVYRAWPIFSFSRVRTASKNFEGTIVAEKMTTTLFPTNLLNLQQLIQATFDIFDTEPRTWQLDFDEFCHWLETGERALNSHGIVNKTAKKVDPAATGEPPKGTQLIKPSAPYSITFSNSFVSRFAVSRASRTTEKPPWLCRPDVTSLRHASCETPPPKRSVRIDFVL